MFQFTKKRAVVMAVVGSLALSAGAYAYFTSTGSGSGGSALVGTSAPWTFTGLSTAGGPLTPGGPTQTLSYTVNNTSSGNQGLTKVAVRVANADGTDWTAVSGCSKDDFKIEDAVAGASYDDFENFGNIPAGASRNNTVTIQMVNDLTRNQNACQGATPPLYLSAS